METFYCSGETTKDTRVWTEGYYRTLNEQYQVNLGSPNVKIL